MSRKQVITERCAECGGDGWVVVGSPREFGDMERESCGACGGNGSATACVLNSAANLIESGTVRWGQASDLTYDVVCMGTAMGRVCNADVNSAAIEHLARTLGWDDDDALGWVFKWNDTPGRTQPQVVRALRSAAEKAL